MAKLTAAARKAMPKAAFAVPATKGFPINNKSHAKAAISGASKAANSGSVSPVLAATIKAEARSVLKKPISKAVGSKAVGNAKPTKR